MYVYLLLLLAHGDAWIFCQSKLFNRRAKHTLENLRNQRQNREEQKIIMLYLWMYTHCICICMIMILKTIVVKLNV